MAGLFVTDITPEQVANARKWIDALRSGKYKQGYMSLRTFDKFCCLGVGRDVVGADWGLLETFPLLWPRERDLLGLTTLRGKTKDGESLTYLNDHVRASFDEIADVIEAELALVVEVTA